MSKKSEAPLSLTDCLCQICMEIFVEPVTLPCNHTLCNSCFQLTVEKASLYCPFCRRRVSSWARYNARKNTLINWELWERIQKNYPEECQRRVNGQDLEEDICISQPLHQLSKPGELRQEYEAEISKKKLFLQVKAERRAHEQEESKASEEYIQRLLAEEEEEHRLAEERQREMEEQLKQDEELAWELSINLNKSTGEHMFSTPLLANSHMSGPSPISSCKTKNKSSNSGDIQKYLSPKSPCASVSMSLSKKAEKGRNNSFSMENNSTEEDILMWQEKDREEMPTLSPQTFSTLQDRNVKDSFLESCLTYLNTSPVVGSHPIEWEGLSGANYQVDKITNTLLNVTKQERPDTGLSSSSGEVARSAFENDNSTCTENIDFEKCAEISSSLQEAVDSVTSGKLENRDASHNLMEVAANCSVEGKKQNVLQNSKETPKRKSQSPTEAAVDLCLIDKRRKTFPETYEDQEEKVYDLNVQMHIDLEKQLYERRKQEEQDRLLALQLQREINREQKTLNRKKGSPDEYLLRPKASPSLEESPTGRGSHKMASESTSPKSQTEMSHRKLRRSSHSENRQPPSKLQMKSPSVRGGKVLNCVNSCDSKDIQSLLTKNKQKTILQMFKRSVSK
ncbi:E3 ubiquitin-protein ligase RNF168 isoform X1 [Dermochelys coriacea]|uniref:E3 ubiquitin-protein ligase RNF168 isoform X1 n=1 Tax=Dermochelys coriacea TaxID=27794 RepID=UPI001CA7D7BC|nr:E3 ubiquitin-protein ligase RNF168 isoform X1 [Dermochelys coriacea]XP_043348648.1 E3 ubiquitin-protein ligase RNF168 isoform X1 [Dermochelys coriacea]XP_043348649.1 E3 ubiquitin-protein ligase RNF168 isoform X1 [Dermochelys coriacea]XP_043348650.1 E3 ubiquitin-protein ligase RNF168 isoform X1 [Dermochelys coriacea]XP_043348651.1 E3 ubiquitin-protein ligase RNF168 isoform X1 [Dermochelys coriacea]XP_043348652.1 E3 ubiquitin-protein ligase RNF168 isoform X1 [Dermochelys coriacea]